MKTEIQKRIGEVDSRWSLSHTEFIPHFDAGMSGKNAS
jgi:hypothetical protein